MEQAIISAVVSDSAEAKVTVAGVPDQPGIAARLFRALADRSINVDMIEQNISWPARPTSPSPCPTRTWPRPSEVCAGPAARDRRPRVLADPDIATVSIVGAGMKTHPGVSATMFETLASEGINIEMISTSSIRLTCVVRADLVEKAVVALHRAFKLEGE